MEIYKDRQIEKKKDVLSYKNRKKSDNLYGCFTV